MAKENHRYKNRDNEKELITFFENTLNEPISFDHESYTYKLYKEDKKFMIETNRPIELKNSTFRFNNIDHSIYNLKEYKMKILDSQIKTSNGFNFSSFNINKFCSNEFYEDKQIIYKLIIPYHEKINIRYHDFFSNFGFMIYIDSSVFGGIEFTINDMTIQMYHLDNNFIIESLTTIEFNLFDKYCRYALASFGFITGFVPMGSGYYFGYEDDNFSQFLFTSTFYDTYKTQYSILTTNAYDYYQNRDLDFSFDNDVLKKDKEIEKLKKQLQPISKEVFEKLVTNGLENDKFSEVVFSMLSINNLEGFSIYLKSGLYTIVLEMITSIISSENKNDDKEIILKKENKRLRETLANKLDKTAKEFFQENDINYDNSIVKKRLNGIYNPINVDKLTEAYSILNIELTTQDKTNIKVRNKFLHGSMPYKDEDHKLLSEKLFYISLELNYLVNALIYKHIGYDGILKNLAKNYLDYSNLKELKDQEYYRQLDADGVHE